MKYQRTVHFNTNNLNKEIKKEGDSPIDDLDDCELVYIFLR